MYIFLIYVYKKYIRIFSFLEIKKYLFIRNSKITDVINVGSNQEQITKLIVKLKRNIKIFSFEPNSLISKPNVYQLALGDKKEEKKLIVPCYLKYHLDSLSSLNLNNILNYLNKYNINKNLISFHKIKTKVTTLDSLNINYQFMKIDTEGYEINVLKGALKSIKKNNPIIMIEKNNDINIYLELLKKFNYMLYDYDFSINKFKKIKVNEGNSTDIYFLNEKSFLYLK